MIFKKTKFTFLIMILAIGFNANSLAVVNINDENAFYPEQEGVLRGQIDLLDKTNTTQNNNSNNCVTDNSSNNDNIVVDNNKSIISYLYVFKSSYLDKKTYKMVDFNLKLVDFSLFN